MDANTERRWDWLTAIVLFLLMQVTAARLVTTEWAPNLYYTESMAGLGTILGLALGASHHPRKIVRWMVLDYTLAVVPWQLSSASTQKLLADRLMEVGGILLISTGQFFQRQPVKDPLFFVAFASLLFWFVCIAAGYWATRHGNILVGVISSGVIVVLIQVYANYQLHSSWWLALYLLLALILVGRGYYRRQEKVWAEKRLYVHDEAWTNIMIALLMVSSAIILVAWAFPTSISSVQAATDAWARYTRGARDRLSNAVTSLSGPYGRAGINYYEKSMLLGQSAAQGDTTVFTVEVLKSPEAILRYYWRARVYDHYDKGSWSSTTGSNTDFEPASTDLPIPDAEARSEAQLRFTMQFPTQSLMYAPSEPVWVSRSASVQALPLDGGLNDILSWQARRTMTTGSKYDVRAQIADPDLPQLRSAPAIYPEWVQQQYLAVPDAIKPRLQALANQVVAGKDNPYDKAAAITAYLRSNLQYQITVPNAPEGRDPVEWVLFNYKKGFCTYYASAEVLMLRSVGIPARLAVGFAQGQYAAGAYTVRRRDAHAWPEAYFPGYGWIEFEPTVSQLPLVRTDPTVRVDAGPSGRPNQLRGEGTDLTPPHVTGPIEKPSTPFTQTLPGRVLMVVLYMAGIAVLVFLFYRFKLLGQIPALLTRTFENSGATPPGWLLAWLRWNELDPVEQAFAPVSWSLRILGKPPAMDETPAGRAARLSKLLPSASPHIDAVARELEKGLFTPEPADVPRARQAGALVLVHTLRFRIESFLGVGEAA